MKLIVSYIAMVFGVSSLIVIYALQLGYPFYPKDFSILEYLIASLNIVIGGGILFTIYTWLLAEREKLFIRGHRLFSDLQDDFYKKFITDFPDIIPRLNSFELVWQDKKIIISDYERELIYTGKLASCLNILSNFLYYLEHDFSKLSDAQKQHIQFQISSFYKIDYFIYLLLIQHILYSEKYQLNLQTYELSGFESEKIQHIFQQYNRYKSLYHK